ncbi:MAG: S41 family peptidase [bacterium]|nr:S41 family peptidase [bacterium]
MKRLINIIQKQIVARMQTIFTKSAVVRGIVIVGIVAIFLGGGAAGYKYYPYSQIQRAEVAFLGEAYGIIRENYWQKVSDEDLSNLFSQGIGQVGGKSYQLKQGEQNERGVRRIAASAMVGMSAEERETFVTTLTHLILQSLPPEGLSALYAPEQREELTQMVNNVDTQEDLYARIGADQNASLEEIQETYVQKKEEAETPEELQQLERALDVLTDEQARARYNETGAQSTVFGRVVSSTTYYLRITRVSPVTFQEFQKEVKRIPSTGQLHTLILDLRDNIGGSVDILPEFLGPFVGYDSYAYEFFHKGEKEPFKTTTGWMTELVPFKRVVILVNENTQSSAEVMVATFQKYNVGVVVGTQTRGVGSIKRVFEMENQINPKIPYSIFLVHSLTLRPDGEAIQGLGVTPTVDMRDPQWKEQLLLRYASEDLATTVEQVWENPPL